MRTDQAEPFDLYFKGQIDRAFQMHMQEHAVADTRFTVKFHFGL